MFVYGWSVRGLRFWVISIMVYPMGSFPIKPKLSRTESILKLSDVRMRVGKRTHNGLKHCVRCLVVLLSWIKLSRFQHDWWVYKRLLEEITHLAVWCSSEQRRPNFDLIFSYLGFQTAIVISEGSNLRSQCYCIRSESTFPEFFPKKEKGFISGFSYRAEHICITIGSLLLYKLKVFNKACFGALIIPRYIFQALWYCFIFLSTTNLQYIL